ncbi:TPA: bifunctional 5,10-methylenetetrahydrofolate dehydrogenase/5,10-methenyltetrahydrofolate cyclohydrolase [Candidatus Micrarchaeota archaeon]|nr:bifunctional 5,10-methylenetetrahydrofolate dehydrogenase/5,10-methenyltetrahydrofolate cyclohydrolase [Candidatus Micrarchaeota archaeon]
MHYQILSGKESAEKILADAKATIDAQKLKPVLGIIVVGEEGPSQVYVKKKVETAAKIGVEAHVHKLPHNAEEAELLKLIKKLNRDGKTHGFIVQLPLPRHMNADKAISTIESQKDVDGFHPYNMGKVVLNQFDDTMFPPATPFGVMKMLEQYEVEISGKNAVVIGRSNIVGKPMALMLLHKNATVTVCHSKTKDIGAFTRNADIIVSAVGSPKLVTADMVKEGAFVIDVGTTKTPDGKLAGDVDFENVIKKANCSPVPGGVGPLTVAMLIRNTVEAAKRAKK